MHPPSTRQGSNAQNNLRAHAQMKNMYKKLTINDLDI